MVFCSTNYFKLHEGSTAKKPSEFFEHYSTSHGGLFIGFAFEKGQILSSCITTFRQENFGQAQVRIAENSL